MSGMRTSRAIRYKIGEGMCMGCLKAITRADDIPRDYADCLACRAHLEVVEGGWEFVRRNTKPDAA